MEQMSKRKARSKRHKDVEFAVDDDLAREMLATEVGECRCC